MADLILESIELARGRGDSTLHFACRNGRENGPYDLDGFAIMRREERIEPLGISVDGQQIIARFAEPLQHGDRIA